MHDDSTFKSAFGLKKLHGAEGVSGDKPAFAYCRIGKRSSHTWFAPTHLLGYEDVKNYDGRWTEGAIWSGPDRDRAGEVTSAMMQADEHSRRKDTRAGWPVNITS